MKKAGFFRLFIRSLPEIWFFQVVIGAILWLPMTVLNTVYKAIAASGDFAVTTANLRTLLSPRVLEMLVCGFLLVLLLVVGEICAPICLCEAIQKQEKTGVWTVNTRRAMKRFLDSEADMIITDDILMAIDVQKELDDRTDYDVIRDRSSDLWFY